MESAPPAARILIEVPEDLPRELVAQFLDSCREDLSRLHVALAASDYDRARRLGHQMKGTGSPYGFGEVTVIGSAIEQAGTACSTAELASQIQLLEAYLQRVEIAQPSSLAVHVCCGTTLTNVRVSIGLVIYPSHPPPSPRDLFVPFNRRRRESHTIGMAPQRRVPPQICRVSSRPSIPGS